MENKNVYSAEERIIYGLRAARANLRDNNGNHLSGERILRDRDTIIEELIWIIDHQKHRPDVTDKVATFSLKPFTVNKENYEFLGCFISLSALDSMLDAKDNRRVYVWISDKNEIGCTISEVDLYLTKKNIKLTKQESICHAKVEDAFLFFIFINLLKDYFLQHFLLVNYQHEYKFQ